MKKKKKYNNDFVVRYTAKKVYPIGLHDHCANDADVMLFFIAEDSCKRQLL